jgi:hypothetical protein
VHQGLAAHAWQVHLKSGGGGGLSRTRGMITSVQPHTPTMQELCVVLWALLRMPGRYTCMCVWWWWG